jgi:hypothetical protein
MSGYVSRERERPRHQLNRVRSILDAIEIALLDEWCPPGHDGAQALTQEAVSLAMSLARIDVVERQGGRP